MKLKYTGPKEIISSHGVSFKRGKDDKYVYIYPAFQLYNALHHDYKKDTIYTHNIEGERIDDEELLNKIFSLKKDIKDSIMLAVLDSQNFLDKEIEEVTSHQDYSKEEQKIFKNNLIIMKNYRLQRQTNKIVYKELIKTIVDDIFEHKIKCINAPFNERYWHILQTLQGELSHHNKRSIGSNLDISHENDTLTISLKINSIGK